MCDAITGPCARPSATSTCAPSALRTTTRENFPSTFMRRWTRGAGDPVSASSSSPTAEKSSPNPLRGSPTAKFSPTGAWETAVTRTPSSRSRVSGAPAPCLGLARFLRGLLVGALLADRKPCQLFVSPGDVEHGPFRDEIDHFVGGAARLLCAP